MPETFPKDDITLGVYPSAANRGSWLIALGIFSPVANQEEEAGELLFDTPKRIAYTEHTSGCGNDEGCGFGS